METPDCPVDRVPELVLVSPRDYFYGQSRDGQEAEDLSQDGQASAVGHIVSFIIDLGRSGAIHQCAIGICFSAIERHEQVYLSMPEAGFLHLDGVFYGGSHVQGMHRDGYRGRACVLCMGHDEKNEGWAERRQSGEAKEAMAGRRIFPLAEVNKSAEG